MLTLVQLPQQQTASGSSSSSSCMRAMWQLPGRQMQDSSRIRDCLLLLLLAATVCSACSKQALLLLLLRLWNWMMCLFLHLLLLL